MSTQEELNSLQRTFNEAIDVLREELVAENLPPLSSSATERHPLDDYDYLASPRLYEARRLLLATVGQVKTLVQFPYEKVYETSLDVYNRSTLETLVKNGLVDFMYAAPDKEKGMHVSEMERALDMSSRKLTIVLRYLATGGWVRETEEGFFVLNRTALELLEGANGRKILMISWVSDIASKLSSWLRHPEWKHSDSAVHTPVQIVHNTNLPLFQWLQTQPDQLQLMAERIRASGDSYISAVLADYPWDSLQGRTILDCGGGLGYLSIRLAKRFPSLNFIIQDLPEVVAMTQSHIASQFPEASDDGQVIAEPQDFFKPQSRCGNDYNYLLRYVLHDWADEDAIKILQNIASAAGPESKVIIIETISVLATVSTDMTDVASALKSLENSSYQQISPPPYIPANFGAAAKSREALVLHLLSLMNAQGRTLNDWKKVIGAAGLELQRVVPLRAEVSILECGLPIPRVS